MYIIDKTNRYNREPDMQELRKDHKTANSEQKRVIENTARKIANESGQVKKMREALVKAHRSGNINEVKDIHDYIRNKSEYR